MEEIITERGLLGKGGETHPSGAQGLFLALSTGIIPSRLGGPYGVLEIEEPR